MHEENRNVVGLASYAAGSRSAAHTVMAKLEAKCRLRSELAKIEAELSAMVTELRPADLELLQQLIIQSADSADRDISALRDKVLEERELSKTTKTASVMLPRAAVQALAAESERRIARGSYPTVQALVGEAVIAQFGER